MEELPLLIPAVVQENNTGRMHTYVIAELLAATDTALGRIRGKTILLPHLYVIRGDKCEKIDIGEATLP